ncbi:hypothetical protein BJV77DRAFT_669390 [Russula vinacea]|nr:hypothetical protein BJV77DRAFT_669390 [Russula vinacea]
MAPEIEEKSMYSPIKADRWSTGRVVLDLLNSFREEDTIVRAAAGKLTAHNPNQRPSMLQVAGSLSDVANIAVEKKASGSCKIQRKSTEKTRSPRGRKGRKFQCSTRWCREIFVNDIHGVRRGQVVLRAVSPGAPLLTRVVVYALKHEYTIRITGSEMESILVIVTYEEGKIAWMLDQHQFRLCQVG